tara:strand:+ start:2427 stop:3767 length:1341 start_codon:yes stop_codon:yes gene_type:complete
MLNKLVKNQGRGGDTELRYVNNRLSHVNPMEASLIDKHGKAGELLTQYMGSGTINPNTGMPEYRSRLSRWWNKNVTKSKPMQAIRQGKPLVALGHLYSKVTPWRDDNLIYNLENPWDRGPLGFIMNTALSPFADAYSALMPGEGWDANLGEGGWYLGEYEGDDELRGLTDPNMILPGSPRWGEVQEGGDLGNMRGLGDIYENITFGGKVAGKGVDMPFVENDPRSDDDYWGWYKTNEVMHDPENPKANESGYVTAQDYASHARSQGVSDVDISNDISMQWGDVQEEDYRNLAIDEQMLLTEAGSLEESVAMNAFRNQYVMTKGQEPTAEAWYNSQQYKDFKSGKYRDQVEDLMVDPEEYDRLLVGGWSPYIQQAQTDPTFDILTAMATSDPTGGLAGSGAYNQWLEEQRSAYQEEQENILSSVLGQIGKERGRLSGDLMKLANLYA